MKKIIALLLLCATAHVQAAPFAEGDPAIGKKLFDQHKCNRCHIDMVGGDGSAIFTRSDRKVNSAKELIQRMYACGGNIGVKFTPQDEQNLGAYLNQNYYKFK